MSLWLAVVVRSAWGTCAGNEDVSGEWTFEPWEDVPGWALNSGTDENIGNPGLTGDAVFQQICQWQAGTLALRVNGTEVGTSVDVDDEGTLTIQKFGKWVSRTIGNACADGGEEE